MKRQYFLTPAAGKAFIAKALCSREDIRKAMQEKTVVVITGTTNRALGKELLALAGEAEDNLETFYRGIVKPAELKLPAAEPVCDLVFVKGKRVFGKNIYDMQPALGEGDIVFKGANAVNLKDGEAGILIGNPVSGTIIPAMQAQVGMRTRLIHPVGVEKRVEAPIHKLALLINAPGTPGLRLFPSGGEVYTEMDAFREFGAEEVELVSAGGVGGMEGGCFFYVSGSDKVIADLDAIMKEVRMTPNFGDEFKAE